MHGVAARLRVVQHGWRERHVLAPSARRGLHGRALPRGEGTLFGIYEHFYDDNALELPDVSTHYVVVAYQVRVDAASLVLPDTQHGQFRWMSVNEILQDPAVHANTRAYFE